VPAVAERDIPPLTRILYVDDEPDIREVARIALETVGGFTVEVCESGEAALRKAPEYRPDLILLDVMMPGLDGPATLRSLRAVDALAAVPVVFFTAKAQRAEIAELLALGAADVLGKPFDPMTLGDALRAIWARYNGRPGAA
jgi:two-component system OmpR family response regulator